MASATAAEHGASAAPRHADAFSPPRDVYAASYWSTSHAAASSAMMMTPPPPPPTRTPSTAAPASFASRAIVTPPSTGNVSMPSASGGFTQRSAGVRARQQLAPRQLNYSNQDAEYSKQDEINEVKHRTAVCPSTPPRVVATSAPSVGSVTPTPSIQYYAVARGRRVGVYTSIVEVYEETQGYDYHVYRLFATRQEAERFIDRYFDVTHGRRGDPDPRHKSTLVAFCDGATQGKRNWSHQTGVACIFPHNSAWDIVYTCLDAYCTAYRATAKAALAAIKRANLENPAKDQVLYIYTRNQLLVRAMTEWMEKWLQNDWRKGDGHPVKNRDVLQSIVDAQGPRRVIWRLEDHWASEWTASVVSAAEDASVDVGELLDAACM